MVKLSQTQLAWVAGIIDGEGTISFTVLNEGKQGNKTKRIQPFISVEMTSKEVIVLLHRWFNGFIYSRKRKDEWSRQWMWKVSSRMALSCIKQIRKYLRVKKSNADLLIEFYSLGTFQGNRKLKDMPEFMKRNSLLNNMRSLNLKGQK